MPNILIDSTTISQAESDFRAIKQSIIDRGTAIPSGTPTSDYPSKIAQIKDEYTLFTPNPSWWDIENILIEDTRPYNHKVIVLLTATALSTNLFGADAFATSDGQFYSTSAEHTWDFTKDLACNLGYKTRYIIYYFNTDMFVHYTLSELGNTLLYVVANNITFRDVVFSYFVVLRSLKLLGASSFICPENATNLFYGAHCLECLPDMDTRTTSALTNAFIFCQSLKISPLIGASSAANCAGMYQGATAMEMIPVLDLSNALTAENMFFNCYSLLHIKSVIKINCSVSFVDSMLDKESVLRLITGLADKTGFSAETLTLHPLSYARLTPAEIAVATAKNWSVV